MSFFSDLLKSVGATLLRRKPAETAKPKPQPSPVPRPGGSRPTTAPAPAPAPVSEQESPGRSGSQATIEVSGRSVGAVHTTYQPKHDGDADPGEVIWTWVPYEENDGRGKDRPVLIVAREKQGTVLAVQLTSKAHDGDPDHIGVGSGKWDSEGRPSWVRLDRVFRVHNGGMRREASALDKAPFDRVIARLNDRYGWS